MAMHISMKHLQINKSGNQLAIIVSVAVVISVFCLISTKSLLSQSSYQRRVLAAKNQAANQLKANVTAANQLVTQYQVFENEDPNIIGGVGGTNPGNGPQDGDNARIVLDALPSQYDFPALISSIEKVLGGEGVSDQGIGGTDQGTVPPPSDPSQITPQAMTFTLDVSGNVTNIQKLLTDIERSIRPIDVSNLQLSGAQDNMQMNISATTYYQPAKTLANSQKEVK
jgi:hypothetical protein